MEAVPSAAGVTMTNIIFSEAPYISICKTLPHSASTSAVNRNTALVS